MTRVLLQVLLLTAVPATATLQLAGITEGQLSSPPHAGSDVDPQSLVYSPDGDWVCFVGDTETEGAGELWCADTAAEHTGVEGQRADAQRVERLAAAIQRRRQPDILHRSGR